MKNNHLWGMNEIISKSIKGEGSNMEDQIEKKDLSSDLINQDLRNLEIEND
jgi:hypothetical protein